MSRLPLDSPLHDDAEVVASFQGLSQAMPFVDALPHARAIRRVIIGSSPAARADIAAALIANLLDTLGKHDLLVESEAVVLLIRDLTRKRLNIPEPK